MSGTDLLFSNTKVITHNNFSSLPYHLIVLINTLNNFIKCICLKCVTKIRPHLEFPSFKHKTRRSYTDLLHPPGRRHSHMHSYAHSSGIHSDPRPLLCSISQLIFIIIPGLFLFLPSFSPTQQNHPLKS